MSELTKCPTYITSYSGVRYNSGPFGAYEIFNHVPSWCVVGRVCSPQEDGSLDEAQTWGFQLDGVCGRSAMQLLCRASQSSQAFGPELAIWSCPVDPHSISLTKSWEDDVAYNLHT